MDDRCVELGPGAVQFALLGLPRRQLAVRDDDHGVGAEVAQLIGHRRRGLVAADLPARVETVRRRPLERGFEPRLRATRLGVVSPDATLKNGAARQLQPPWTRMPKSPSRWIESSFPSAAGRASG